VPRLKRIVKLQLTTGSFGEFKAIFNFGKNVVARSKGCFGVELVQDINDPDLVFTLSEWLDEEALNAYRESKEFKNYWPKIKDLLKEKAEVWSLQSVDIKDGQN